MYQTIQVSSCVSVQGDFVDLLPNGDMLIRDGGNVYRGRPITANGLRLPAAIVRALGAAGQRRDEG
jgi:hypothetical protein